MAGSVGSSFLNFRTLLPGSGKAVAMSPEALPAAPSKSATKPMDANDRRFTSADVVPEPRECARCKHYRTLEKVVDAMNRPISPTFERLKVIIYWIGWILLALATLALVNRKELCHVIDGIEARISNQ
uniref:LITAF domain-containing protein n=1 Tax=Panagrellus redivivus TaxID=6233 RepID=A0A7E4W3V3_PANRE